MFFQREEEDPASMKKNQSLIAAMAVLISVIACGMPSFLAKPTETPEPTATMTVPTPIKYTRTPRQDATEIIILPTATQTPPATETPLPSATSTVTATPIPCYWAQFISDVSYPDDSEVIVGQGFVKTWRFKNIGTCTWNANFKVVFAQGNGMGLPATGASIGPNPVGPGGFVDISISLVAPSDSGPYQGYFRLKAPDGTVFGIGPTADGKFWVRIVAVYPTATPTITPTETK
jgi:hypothetical protein